MSRAEAEPATSHRRGPRGVTWLASLVLFLASCGGSGPQTSLEPRSDIGRTIDGLWDLVFWIAVVIFILVQGVLLVSVFRFRERKGQETEPIQVHGNTPLEITWTIIPAVILAVIAVPTLQALFDVRTPPTGDDVLQVQVTGHQWWWEFEYPDLVDGNGVPLVTANELHIPAGATVNLSMTSTDVIHAFWVPVLNGKRDVVPGRITNLTLDPDADLAGEVLSGQCTEFCGLAHADMRLKVFVDSPAEFNRWAAGQLGSAAAPTDEDLASAFELFSATCTACHQATVVSGGLVETLGPDRFIMAGDLEFRSSLAPNLTHFGGRTTFGGAILANDTQHLAAWIDEPAALKPMDPDRNEVEAGFILGMPDYGLGADEIDQLVALLQSWK